LNPRPLGYEQAQRPPIRVHAMWRDRDPYREQHVPDTFWLVVAVLLFAACGLVWLIGQVAAICFGAHEHLPVRLVDMLGVLLRLLAPGTTRPGPGRRPSGRCCLGQWACMPPLSRT
jgi:hypothetical protein